MKILCVFLMVPLLGDAAAFPEKLADSEAIRDEQYRQMDRHFTSLIAKSGQVRAQYWSRLDFSSPEAYDRSAGVYREAWAKYLAVPDPGKLPLNARRVKVQELPAYTAYRVWLDTIPGVQAYGILLIPKSRRMPRPGLICLHGHGGNPEVVAGFVAGKELDEGTYRVFARTAAERGYVVWCPYVYSLYSEEQQPAQGPGARGRDLLHKKALLTGHTLMGLEVAKIRRGVDYLQTLPEVDPSRIGMYGLSKGGHYTLYTAPLEKRIRAAVVSGWFNHRARKLLALADGSGTMFFLSHIHRSEYYLCDLLDRFGDAELAWMIAPRPLLIENGSQDGAVLIRDAREEFQRVAATYRRLGLDDHTRFASFDGPHRIDGVESFPFLDKWLRNDAQ